MPPLAVPANGFVAPTSVPQRIGTVENYVRGVLSPVTLKIVTVRDIQDATTRWLPNEHHKKKAKNASTKISKTRSHKWVEYDYIGKSWKIK